MPKARIYPLHGSRKHLKPLHGSRKVRYFRGILYPHVRKGNTFLKKVVVSLSKNSQEEHLHFDDPVIALHDGDFDLNIFGGLPVRRGHNKKNGKSHMFGDIGVWDGAMINKKRELEAWGRLYGDIPEGYQAIVDYDHGDLTGLSIKFINHISDGSNLMLGKTIEEGSLTPTGGAHYDDCLITVSCSKNPTTNSNSYTTNSEDKRNNYWDCEDIKDIPMNDNGSNNSQLGQGNGNAPPQSIGQFSNGNNNQQEEKNPLGNNNGIGGLINELRGQLKTENEAKKSSNARLAEQDKALLLLQKEVKFFKEKEQKRVEEKNKEILKDLPDVLNILSSFAGIKDVSELNPKTVKLIETAWTDPDHQQFMEMTKSAARAMVEHEKEGKLWAAQRKRFGMQMKSNNVAVGASQAQNMLDNVKDDNRRERLRQQKMGLAFEDVYTPSTEEVENEFGSQYNGLFSGSNYGNWGHTEALSSNAIPLGPEVPIVRKTGPTMSKEFSAMSNYSVRDISVGAAAPKHREQRESVGKVRRYEPHPENRFRSSINRFGWGRAQFAEAMSMDRKTASSLCPVTVSRAPVDM